MTNFLVSTCFAILLIAVTQCNGQKGRFRSDGSVCFPCSGVPCPLDGKHQCNCGICLNEDGEVDRCPSCAKVDCPLHTHQCICGVCWSDGSLPDPRVPCPSCRNTRCPILTHQCVCGKCELNRRK